MTVSRKPIDAASYFGQRASFYDGRYDACGADGYALRSRLSAVIRLAGEGRGDSLDAGMGPGRLCVALDECGWSVSGVDASAAMVDVARASLPSRSDRLLAAPIESLPFAADSFDLVTATGVLEYALVGEAIAELVRVLRPGGRLIVSYPNPDAYYGIWKSRVWYRALRVGKRLLRRSNPELPRGAGVIPPATFEGLLRAAGLRTLDRTYTSFLVLPAPVDELLPAFSARIGAFLERHRAASPRRIATQVVYLARLDAPAAAAR